MKWCFCHCTDRKYTSTSQTILYSHSAILGRPINKTNKQTNKINDKDSEEEEEEEEVSEEEEEGEEVEEGEEEDSLRLAFLQLL